MDRFLKAGVVAFWLWLNKPSLKPFKNLITGTILLAVIGLITGGCLLALFAPFWWSIIGVIMIMMGVLIWHFGNTDHPGQERTAGLITVWDTPLKGPTGEGITLGGRTILMPYFPFYIDTIKFSTTNLDKDFPVKILSADRVPLEGIVSITLRPNLENAVSFVQATRGKTENVLTQIDDIIYECAKSAARSIPSEEIAKSTELISRPVFEALKKKLKRNPEDPEEFGVDIIKVQSRFDLPERILEAMTTKQEATYNREGDLAMYDTYMIAAKKRQEEYTAQGVKKTLEACHAEIKELKLIDDGLAVRVETSGSSGAVVVENVRIGNVGNQQRQNRKNKNKSKNKNKKDEGDDE